MEIRARYTLIGLFTLATVVAAFAFVYWLNHAGGLTQQARYRAQFDGSVSGLLKGSAVLFNGIRVGEVVALELDTANPKVVTAVMSVDRDTPVRSDTKVGIEFQGLTSSPVLSLMGGVPNAAPIAASGSEPPLLTVDPNATHSITDSARGLLRRIDDVIAENREPLKTLIANIDTFSAALAKNSDKVDGILSGLERLTGGGKKANVPVIDILPVQKFNGITKIPEGQLVVPEPDVVGSVFNDQVAVITPSGERSPAFDGKWPDTLSRVFQSRVVQSFENAGYLKVMGRQPDALKVDYQLVIDLRSFQVIVSDHPTAEIAFSAKIVGDGGQILGAKLFTASVPATITDQASVAAALNTAFDKVIGELVVWTLNTA
ncbi:MlaD family protein [Hyphomicrobium sp.]|uniref:ABC-type transport auxiliary lipoprotein family protein n=1 Tax=Hyphomicrobium sp. TaxID=82 RepID=UPI000F945B91|nr:MlaD family protein [Hyphomicrobium sp.]RUO97774.1 MAG: MCE family protein [Hyphomicrobium sp.]